MFRKFDKGCNNLTFVFLVVVFLRRKKKEMNIKHTDRIGFKQFYCYTVNIKTIKHDAFI